MFGTEAEEWVIDSVCRDCSRYEKCKSKEHCTCKECSKEKWQCGAKFGYNKAKVEIEESYRESLCNSELNLAHVTDQLKELEKACEETQELLDKQIAATYKLGEENVELKEKISYLEDNLRVARKDRENLQLDVARGLKEFVKDFPATSLRYLANEKYIEQLTKAKKIIKNLMVFAEMDSREYEKEYKEAEQFLKEAEE